MPRSAATNPFANFFLMLVVVTALVLGIVLGLGGVWLITLGGSWYYALAGAGLVASGVLLWRREMAGVWLYTGIFVATLIWALWERGFNGWAHVPRVLGPAVLLVLVLLTIPVLRRAETSPAQSDRRQGRGSGRLVAFAGLSIIAGLGIGVVRPEQVPAQNAPPVGGPTNAVSAVQGQTGGQTASQAASNQTVSQNTPYASSEDWAAYGGTYASTRYSTLAQITRDNVDQLQPAWTFRTGDMPSGEAEGKYSPENTPLKVGDTVYICSAMGIVIAVDAATGTEKWRFDPEVSPKAIPYGATCRGVAYHQIADAAPTDPCSGRILWGTLDARLLAVDARTGQLCTGFGTGGTVDLNVGIGETVPGWYSVTSPPTIVRGVAIMGAQVKDGQAEDAPSGVVRGYDVVTGSLVWAWDLGNPAITGLPPEGGVYTRGTPNMWTIASGDEALGLVYLPLGNSSVDYYGSQRSAAENQYSTSLVALDAQTGAVAWSFQTVRNDVWDYDLGSQGTLIDFPVNGVSVPALLLPSKQGDIYVLDRRTGTPLVPIENRPAPKGGVEPDYLSPTQPFSLYHTLAKRTLVEADMWGFTAVDQLWCRIQFRKASYQGIYTPPTTDRHWIQYPGYNGGSDWGGVAVDLRRGLIIANYNDMPNHNRLVPRAEADRAGLKPINAEGGERKTSLGEAGPQTGAPYAIDVNAGWRVPLTGLLCKEPPYGGIRAIELASGRTVWDKPFGTARKNGPFGIPSGLPLTIGTPNNGGSVVTASGLIFIAAATDDLFRAIDTSTGEVVWQVPLPAGGQANPFTYEINGRQYVGIMAGGHHFMETPIGDHVLTWALPQR